MILFLVLLILKYRTIFLINNFVETFEIQKHIEKNIQF